MPITSIPLVTRLCTVSASTEISTTQNETLSVQVGARPQLQERSVTDVLANMSDSHGAGGADAPAAWVALPAMSASVGQALLPGSMSMA